MWTDEQLTPWLAALRSGRIAAAPAEGVYGYVANPFAPSALQMLLETKQRSANKGFIVLIQNTSQLELFCPPLPEACRSAVTEFWHQGHPVTLILPALPNLPEVLNGNLPTIAIRMPQKDYMQAYLWAAGMPLVSTSLNLAGEPAAISAEQIPAGTPALTLPHPLSGIPSRIFHPMENTWLR